MQIQPQEPTAPRLSSGCSVPRWFGVIPDSLCLHPSLQSLAMPLGAHSFPLGLCPAGTSLPCSQPC